MHLPENRSSRPLSSRAPGRIALLAACAAAALFLPGCSNNPYPAGQTGEKVIFRALRADLRTIDPTTSYVQDEAVVLDAICPSYFKYHYLKQKPYTLELALGAEEPKREPYVYTETVEGKPVQRRGEQWSFRLKPGIRFQDDPCFPGGKGREVVAADILYAFKRMGDITLSPPSPVLSFFEDKIIGMAEFVANNRKLREQGKSLDLTVDVPGLQADPNDPYRFKILLNQPYPQLRYMMAMHFTTPIPREAVEKYGAEYKRHPVGCGAFMIEEYTQKRRLVLVKNPNRLVEYYPSEGDPGDAEAGLLESAGQQLPLADRVVFNFIREPITIWNLFLQGYQDRWGVTQETFSQVMTGQRQLSEGMREKGIRLHTLSFPNIYYFCFNMTDPVVGGYTPEKRKLRQAISTAIDSQEFIELYFQGVGTKPEFLIPPGLFGYDPEYKNPYRRFSVGRAKQLLAEAGYPNGIDRRTGDRLTLYYDNTATTPSERQFIGLLQKQIEAIGIKFEGRTFRDVVWQDRVDKGQFQFIRYGWLADYPDPENFVFLLYGPNKRPGPNHGAYDNPEYNRLFEQMRAMDDGPERLALIKQMRAIAEEDCPWVYITHDEELLLNHEWLGNVKPHGVANDAVKYWSIDPARRKQLLAQWNQPNFWPAIVTVALLVGISIPAASVVRQRRRRKVRRPAREEVR